jgi:3-oxoacyl-[acyl-carrier-protein] synthase III
MESYPAMRYAQIAGVGSYLPEGRLTNADLEKMVDTSDEWILQRVGISERRVVAEDESTSDLAARAGLSALASAGMQPGDIDMLVLATSSPDFVFPSTACLTQTKMGLTCPAFDVMAACTGFVYALQVATDAIAAGRHKTVLLIGADAMTRHIDFTDRSTCVLFGDGAGAVVLTAADDPGVMSVELGAEGSGADVLRIPVGAAAPPSEEMVLRREQYLTMSGNEVFKFAVRAIPDITFAALADAGHTVDELRWVIPHQANQRIIDTVADRLGIPHERVVSTIRECGNTSTASIPLALDGLYTSGNLAPGDLIAFVGFGAGLTWGAAVVRWTKEAVK